MSRALVAVPMVGVAFETPTTGEFVFDCWHSPLHVFGIDFCMNFITFLLLLAVSLFVLMFWTAFRRPKVVPGKWQAFVEMGIGFIREQVVMSMIGPDGLKYLPFLATLFFFIFIGNVFGVTPGLSFPLNSRIAFPMVMAVIAWLVYNTIGVRRHGLLGYLKVVGFPPGAPKLLYVLLTPIEFVTVFLVRPLTLTVRLWANMVAGHFLLVVFFLGTITLLTGLPYVLGLVSFGLAIVLVGFEIFVATLQAFIFSILTASYIAGAMAEEH